VRVSRVTFWVDERGTWVALKSGLKSIVECHISQKAHKIVRFHLFRECLTFDTRRDNLFDFPSIWPDKQQMRRPACLNRRPTALSLNRLLVSKRSLRC
jgi:hypothetical protein